MAKYKLPKIEEMLEAGVHFGHQARRWHPKMEKYIYTVNKDIHIIDLEQTEKKIKEACDFLYETAKEGKKIIFVGTKKQFKDIIELEAKRCGALYVKERWIGGTITNFPNIKKNLDRLLDLMKGREDGRFDKYTKKERLLIDRDIEKSQNVYGGILSLKGTPGVLFIIDPRREKTAIREAKSLNVPTVALVDTNADPTTVDYPIPGNDDAIKSVALIMKAISSAIEEGYSEYDKIKDKEKAQEESAKEEAVAEALKTAEIASEETKEIIEKFEKEVEENIAEEVKEDIKEEIKEETSVPDSSNLEEKGE